MFRSEWPTGGFLSCPSLSELGTGNFLAFFFILRDQASFARDNTADLFPALKEPTRTLGRPEMLDTLLVDEAYHS